MTGTKKWKIGLYLAALYLAGVFTGLFVAKAIVRHLMMAAMNQDKMAAHWVGELKSKLDLTPAQVEKIAPIVNGALSEFRGTFAGQILTTVSNSNARIAAELTPEQMPKFVELKKQQQDFIQQRLGTDTTTAQK